MWIVAWTEDQSPDGHLDFYSIHADEADAKQEYLRVKKICYCACMAPISDATEPHWVEGE